MAGKQKFKEDSIGALSKVNATTVELAASLVTIGGLQYDTGTLSLSTLLTGVGGLDAGPVQNNKVYNVFAILSSEEPALIASLLSAPSGYTVYTKVGAFNTDIVGDAKGTSEKDQGKVGDIIHSMLTEEQFILENGGGWVLADGRDVTGSKYATVTGNTTVPDMRGQFLRGKNNTRSDGNQNPDGDVGLGAWSQDTYQEHTHQSKMYSATDPGGTPNPYVKSDGGMADRGLIGPSAAEGFGTPRVGFETRPKNITVNIFIKIEDIN
jgi:hypothetical protein